MKKFILIVAVFVFGAIQLVSAADDFAVKCTVPADSEFACKNFPDMAAADAFKAEMKAKAVDCVVASEKCPTPKPSAKPEVKDPGVVKLDNPLALSTDIKIILGTVIKGIFGIMGGLVLLMVVWGGSTWLTAAGSPEKIKSGSQTILWALLGAIVTTASYIILNGIMKAFFG